MDGRYETMERERWASRSSKSITIFFVRHIEQSGQDINSVRGLSSLFIWDHGVVPVKEIMTVIDCMAIRRESLARAKMEGFVSTKEFHVDCVSWTNLACGANPTSLPF